MVVGVSEEGSLSLSLMNAGVELIFVVVMCVSVVYRTICYLLASLSLIVRDASSSGNFLPYG